MYIQHVHVAKCFVITQLKIGELHIPMVMHVSYVLYLVSPTLGRGGEGQQTHGCLNLFKEVIVAIAKVFPSVPVS